MSSANIKQLYVTSEAYVARGRNSELLHRNVLRIDRI